MPPTLFVRSLRKSFGARLVLDEVDLTIASGEVVALLGGNGAGKSTLFHLVTGLLAPDAGTIAVHGGAGPRDPSVRARIGYAPQTTALYDALSVVENLRFFGRVYGVSAPTLDDRIDGALAMAGLESRRRERVGTLSGGMRRRLHVAVATLHAPALLLLDEPTTGVDATSRLRILESVRAFATAERGVLMATHVIDDARACDRVAVLDAGRVVALDSVSAIAERFGGGDLAEAVLSLSSMEAR